MLELTHVRTLSGEVELPPNPDIFLLCLLASLASGRTARIAPVEPTYEFNQWKEAFASRLAFDYTGNTCTVVPEAKHPERPVLLPYGSLPYRDLVVFFMASLDGAVALDHVPLRRLEVWRRRSAQFGFALDTKSDGNHTVLTLSPQPGLQVPKSPIPANDLHAFLGIVLGAKQNCSFDIEYQFQTPVRHLLEAAGFSVDVRSNTGPSVADPVARRMLRMTATLRRRSDPGLSFTVSIDFSRGTASDLEIVVPGDDILAAVLLCAKCLVQKGQLIVSNLPLEAWSTAVLGHIRKMGCKPAIQTTCAGSFGEVGSVSLQRFELVGRKAECVPLFLYERQLPVLVVLASYASGQSVFRELAELRAEEPDPIEQMLGCVRTLGGRHGEMPDGMVIDGAKHFDGFDLEQELPPALSAACTMAGLKCAGKSSVNDVAMQRRWPGFSDLLARICEHTD